MAGEHEPVEQRADRPAGRGKLDLVDHVRAIAARLESMDVIESSKGTAHLAIAEVMRPVELDDLHREAMPNAHVPRFPCDFLARSDEARGDAGDGPLAGAGHGALVKVDVAREIETGLGRRGDFSANLDAHGVLRGGAGRVGKPSARAAGPIVAADSPAARFTANSPPVAYCCQSADDSARC